MNEGELDLDGRDVTNRPDAMKDWGRIRALGLCLLALVLGSCATAPSTASRPIDSLDLFLTSVALNLDGKPGVDGFGARIYASSRRSAQGAILTDGRLDIVVYDGVVPAQEMPKGVPLRTWSYSAAELKPHAQKTSIGTGYLFALAWGDAKPRAERITVIARYIAPDGVVVPSAPGTIPLDVK